MGQFRATMAAAKKEGGPVVTTYLSFVGYDDLFAFLEEASKEGVEVVFAPMHIQPTHSKEANLDKDTK